MTDNATNPNAVTGPLTTHDDAVDTRIPESARVRPLTLAEHRRVIAYFHNCDDDLLATMGVVRSKLIPPDEWLAMMADEYTRPIPERTLSYVGWEYDGELVGHSNVNQMTFGDHANIHLHMWDSTWRRRGLGLWFFASSVNFFWHQHQLKLIICEPRAENPAPNRLLTKLGLRPVRTYRTIPGIINVEQSVTRYEITAPFPE